MCDLDDELVAITDGLKAKGWSNTDDFRFKKCALFLIFFTHSPLLNPFFFCNIFLMR